MATGTDIYTIELVDLVTGRATRASHSVQRLGAGLDKAGKSGRFAQFALNAAASAIGNIAARGFGHAIDAVKNLGSAIYDTAKLASKSKFQLAAFFGGPEAGAKAMASGVDLTNRYGLELESVLDSMAKFRGAGFNLAQTEDFVKLAADLRLSGEEVKRFARAIGQIRGGPLRAEEINQLIDLAPNAFGKTKIFDVLAERLGKTRAEVLKLQEAGKISGADLGVSAVLESGLRSIGQTEFGVLGERAANETVDGLINRIKARFETDMFGAIAAAEQPLVAGLQAVLKGFTGTDTTNFGAALTAGLTALGQKLQEIGPQIPSFIASIERLATVIGDLVAAIRPLLDVAGAVGGGISKIFGGIFGGAAFDLADTAANAAARRDARERAYDQGRALAGGTVAGINDGAPKVAAAADALMHTAEVAAANAAEIKSPSRVFAGLGQEVDAGLAMGISADADLAFSAAREMTEGTIDAAERAALVAPGGTLKTAIVDRAAGAMGEGGGRRVDVGGISVSIALSGGGDAAGAAEAVRDWFATEFGAILERHLEGVGA